MDRRHTLWSLLLGSFIPCAVLASPCAPVDRHMTALALSCEGCHGRGGNSIGPIPSLAGQPVEELEHALLAFQDAPATQDLMPRLLQNVPPATLRLWACYFSQQQ